MNLLEAVERQKDISEQTDLESRAFHSITEENNFQTADWFYDICDENHEQGIHMEFDENLDELEINNMDEIIEKLHAETFSPTHSAEDENEANDDIDEDQQGRQSFGKRIPKVDSLQNQYIRVVHTNGVHHLPMVTCSCQDNGSHDELAFNLMAICLDPSSFA